MNRQIVKTGRDAAMQVAALSGLSSVVRDQGYSVGEVESLELIFGDRAGEYLTVVLCNDSGSRSLIVERRPNAAWIPLAYQEIIDTGSTRWSEQDEMAAPMGPVDDYRRRVRLAIDRILYPGMETTKY